ncbi:MAG: hypothetical protein ACYTF9_16540 [Planctomycetota bacterium]|jgi:hypothetical protein
MNNFVVLLHEIGHAKQFIEQPAIFASGASDSNTPAAMGRRAAVAAYDKAASEGAEALRKGGMAYSKASREMQARMGLPPHKAFSSIIEWDNYTKHEGPICDEAGIMRRGFYANIGAHFPSVVKW